MSDQPLFSTRNPWFNVSVGVTAGIAVLATITGYVYQAAVTDSEIDNLKDRRLLASTDVLTKAVQCLIDQFIFAIVKARLFESHSPRQLAKHGHIVSSFA